MASDMTNFFVRKFLNEAQNAKIKMFNHEENMNAKEFFSVFMTGNKMDETKLKIWIQNTMNVICQKEIHEALWDAIDISNMWLALQEAWEYAAYDEESF